MKSRSLYVCFSMFETFSSEIDILLFTDNSTDVYKNHFN